MNNYDYSFVLFPRNSENYFVKCFLFFFKVFAVYTVKMDLIEFETSAGTFTVELYRLHAPKTCYNFTELVKIGWFVCTEIIFTSLVH